MLPLPSLMPPCQWAEALFLMVMSRSSRGWVPDERNAAPAKFASAQAGDQLEAAQAMLGLVQVAGEDQLVGAGRLQQHLQARTYLLRSADHRQAEEVADRLLLVGQPAADHALHRRAQQQVLAADQ